MNNRFNLVARLLSILLILQYILGMLSNLYASLPDSRPYSVFYTFGFIPFHALNAIFLLLLSLWYLINSKKQNKSRPIASFGHISVGIAFISGFIFISFGHNDIFSFIMSLGFIFAFVTYFSQAFKNEDAMVSNQ